MEPISISDPVPVPPRKLICGFSHTRVVRNKTELKEREKVSVAVIRMIPFLVRHTPDPMSDKIRHIVRTQWSRRHSCNPLVRAEARNLIRVHVQLLRNQVSPPRGNELGLADSGRESAVADAA